MDYVEVEPFMHATERRYDLLAARGKDSLEEVKVLIVTGHYPPPYTANAVRAYYLVKALANSGYKVTVLQLISSVTGVREGFFGEQVIMPFGGLNETSKPSLHRRALDLLRKFLKGDRFRLKEYFDVVIATLPPLEAIPLGRRISQECGAKLICDIQDLSDEWKIMERPLLKFIIKASFRSVYNALKVADAIFTTTESMKDVIIQRTNNKEVFIIPNGVDIEFFKRAYLKRKSLGSDRGRRHVKAVFLGDLNWVYHALDSLIEVIGILRGKGVDLHLDVIGTGKLKPMLETLARRSGVSRLIRFHGYVKREKIPELLGEGDFGVVGRKAIDNLWVKTTIRLTTYEYLASGLPVLAYGPPGSYTERFIETENIGVYIPSSNPKDIADSLSGGGLDELKRISPDHVRKVAERYDWNKVMRRAVNIMEEVLQR